MTTKTSIALFTFTTTLCKDRLRLCLQLTGRKATPLDLVHVAACLLRQTSSNGGVSNSAIICTSRRHFGTLIRQMAPLLDSDRELTFSARRPVCSWCETFMLLSRRWMFSAFVYKSQVKTEGAHQLTFTIDIPNVVSDYFISALRTIKLRTKQKRECSRFCFGDCSFEAIRLNHR